MADYHDGTDGRTDGRWTVGGRTPGRKNPRIWLIYPDGWLAGWLAKTLVPEARAGGRTKNGRTDGRWTDGGRTVDGHQVLVPDARAGGRTKNGRTDGRTVDGRWTDARRKIRNI